MLVISGTQLLCADSEESAGQHSLSRWRFYFSVSVVLLITADFSAPSDHTAGSSHKRPSRVFLSTLSALIFQTPPEQPTELSTPNVFFSSKFQSTSAILPKAWSSLSKASKGSWNPQEGLWSQSYFANIQQCCLCFLALFSPKCTPNFLAVAGYTASQQSHAGQTWAQLASTRQWPTSSSLCSACYLFWKLWVCFH